MLQIDTFFPHIQNLVCDLYELLLMQIAEHAFGLRSPDSEGIGKWDGAFVYCNNGGKRIFAVFHDNRDFIGRPASIAEVYDNYNSLIRRHKWIPMSRIDLELTAGIKTDGHTHLEASDRQQQPSRLLPYPLKLAFERFRSIVDYFINLFDAVWLHVKSVEH